MKCRLFVFVCEVCSVVGLFVLRCIADVHAVTANDGSFFSSETFAYIQKKSFLHVKLLQLQNHCRRQHNVHTTLAVPNELLFHAITHTHVRRLSSVTSMSCSDSDSLDGDSDAEVRVARHQHL
jgi:hypothetical protein